jgi:hypothetical protein
MINDDDDEDDKGFFPPEISGPVMGRSALNNVCIFYMNTDICAKVKQVAIFVSLRMCPQRVGNSEAPIVNV